MNRFDKPRWLLFLIPFLLVTGCGPKTGGQPEETAIPVSTHQVTTRDLPETLLLPGRVVAKQEAPVTAKLPGKVQEVYAKVGDSVQSGQLLALLEVPGAESNVNQARAALQAMEAQYARMQQSMNSAPVDDQDINALRQQITERLAWLGNQAQSSSPDRTELERAGRELVELQAKLAALTTQRAVSESVRGFTAPLLQSIEAQINQARQAVRMAEAQAGAGRITSPINGVVLAQTAAKGTPATPGYPLFSVGTAQEVEFELLVDPAQQAKLKQGQAVNVQVESLPALTSQITSVSPALQPQMKSFTARAPLPAATADYKPGMFGQAIVTIHPHQGVLAVPKQVVLQDQSGPYVLSIRENRAVQVRVERGYDNGTWVEILKGLKKGDQVISEGIERVHPDALVKVVTTKQGTGTSS